MGPATEVKRTVSSVSAILLVEDELIVRETTRNALECAGYHVFEAEGAEDAIIVAAAAGVTINVLLTDLVMRGMDGLSLSRHLRQLYPSMGAILMSGYLGEDVARKLPVTGATAYLQKPFTLSKLCDLVSQVIAGGGSDITEEQTVIDSEVKELALCSFLNRSCSL